MLPIKGNVEIDPAGSNKLIDAVLDVFAPATETLGLLGDAVRLARVEVAAKITRRAKEIADESDSVLKTPPLKFLVPFYEKASIEEDDDIEAHERWAQLLASAGSAATVSPVLINLMSQIESPQAKVLRDLYFGKLSGAQEYPKSIVERPFNAIDQRFESSRIEFIRRKVSKNHEGSLDHFADSVQHYLNGRGIYLKGFVLSSADKNDREQIRDRSWRSFNLDDLDILGSLGLCEDRYYNGAIQPELSRTTTYVEVEVTTITKIGIQFLATFDPTARDEVARKLRRSIHST